MEKALRDLRVMPLFAALPTEALAEVARAARRHRYRAGELILVEGGPCSDAFFVAQGHARASRLSPGGREQVLAQLGPGQGFNTVPPFLPQCAAHATVQAVTDVVCYVVGRDDLRRLVGCCPELGLALLEDFARRLDHLTNLVEDLALRSVRSRLARFLLEHVGEEEARRWTQDEMAAQLGTVRDVVGRTLRAFADGGLISIDRQRIVLLDREGLLAEAEV
ncbi:MAG: Crp/Fnr family transcriptional regulator [Chloroflexi bacterium]|nr:Crp/Fnr family transcriptional regulator [Chloroflexota bacterium]